MVTYDQALTLLTEAATPLGVERVPVRQAAGRVLARAVRARVDAPRHDASAMDGYALRDSDLCVLPVRLKVVGTSFPGDAYREPISSGECARIFTGAPMPAGTDRVVAQEAAERDDDFAVITAAPSARHVRRRASDFAVGDVLLEPGRRLQPRALVTLAGADRDAIEVWRRPVVSILSAGDELVEPGMAAATPGSIPESVSMAIAAMVENCGGIVSLCRRLPDDLETMKSAGAEALQEADLVVVTGGASVGERDFARAMFEDTALDLIFSKIAIKPGKPAWLGRARGRLVLGLPGNPSSALVAAQLLLIPLLSGLSGQDPASALRWRRAPLANPAEPCGERDTFLRARWEGETAFLLSNQDSSAQGALAHAELLVRRRALAPGAAAGDLVELIEF